MTDRSISPEMTSNSIKGESEYGMQWVRLRHDSDCSVVSCLNSGGFLTSCLPNPGGIASLRSPSCGARPSLQQAMAQVKPSYPYLPTGSAQPAPTQFTNPRDLCLSRNSQTQDGPRCQLPAFRTSFRAYHVDDFFPRYFRRTAEVAVTQIETARNSSNDLNQQSLNPTRHCKFRRCVWLRVGTNASNTNRGSR
ncbi:hypothetical protein T310_4026 [Rasamsonia emersonii CBS 393.64]|uniref:Uncharacterized protein n=1 Tax=Rasamsonia emersonii (strain ATCC 16479 / CBS 393.64 / IMI 116815) TaxID=1408163 RepID=A0A0F4YUQ3_RASE3|nr:hypothetical protein T310_4026 [Rasamsonia emersonii CBS 393.64]KKA21964.1 hypothetical protein T310_4026 [Rasamsonia emersonii CBS 393.64]